MSGYTGWLLPEADRAALLAAFPPVYPNVIAHHVTLKFPAKADSNIPEETSGSVIGVADDGEGVQALVVEIGGTVKRPDGKVFHITWSLDRAKGFSAHMSNDVIRTKGWKALAEPIDINLEPKFFE